MEQENYIPNESSTSAFQEASKSPSDTCQLSAEESMPHHDSDSESYEPGVSSKLQRNVQNPIENPKERGMHYTALINE